MDGQRLGGRYQLEARIGGGGMAIVYKAKDLLLNRQVAVKILRHQYGNDEDFVMRFRREAQAVASLSHPNVVSVYDVGQDADTHYMVMEYIEGSTLKEMINQRGALPVEEAVHLAVQICDALDHAHQNQIIHRDIKPHNILIGKNGRIKVTDFGIARAVTSATITHTNAVLGSVHYFSPEQARGGITGEKSDIYSLGIVLYEMVTGQLPFSGDSPISVALKHLQDPLPEPRTVNPQIPQSVENVILKALVKDPSLRYESAKVMLDDLETCLSPERRNEPKIEFPVDDEQTRVLPVITPEMLESQQERESLHRGHHQEEDEQTTKKSKWWLKAIAWFGAAALFVILVLFGLNLAQYMFDVPEVEVPHVEGAPLVVAEGKIKEKNLVPKPVEEFSSTVDAGMVIRQDPKPPMRAKENSTVVLYVSKGKEKKPMPSVMGQSRDAAEQMLKSIGFKAENITIKEKEDESVPPGQVIDQSPQKDQVVTPEDDKVELTISKGKDYVPMPDLRGMTIDQAKVELFKKGLEIDQNAITEQPSYRYDKAGYVLSTTPWEPNNKVAVGQKIPLQLSNGTYPADAKITSRPVTVEIMSGQPVRIRIVVTDARGKQTFVDETITESRDYNVPLILSPTKNGLIQVYENDIPDAFQTITADYQNEP